MTANYAALNEADVGSELDPFTEPRYRQFLRHMPSSVRHVLDVGCATGRGGAVLKKERPDLSVFGLDCVRHRLERLPETIYDGWECGLSTAAPFPDRMFDAIVAGEFIEHIHYSDGIATLAEFFRMLTPSGMLLMTTPNPDFVKLQLTGRSIVGGPHVSAHYPKQLSVMMKDAGFTDVAWCGSGRTSLLFGERAFMNLYGSFLIWGRKPSYTENQCE